jgi:hypothetical protein
MPNFNKILHLFVYQYSLSGSYYDSVYNVMVEHVKKTEILHQYLLNVQRERSNVTFTVN